MPARRRASPLLLAFWLLALGGLAWPAFTSLGAAVSLTIAGSCLVAFLVGALARKPLLRALLWTRLRGRAGDPWVRLDAPRHSRARTVLQGAGILFAFLLAVLSALKGLAFQEKYDMEEAGMLIAGGIFLLIPLMGLVPLVWAPLSVRLYRIDAWGVQHRLQPPWLLTGLGLATLVGAVARLSDIPTADVLEKALAPVFVFAFTALFLGGPCLLLALVYEATLLPRDVALLAKGAGAVDATHMSQAPLPGGKAGAAGPADPVTSPVTDIETPPPATASLSQGRLGMRP